MIKSGVEGNPIGKFDVFNKLINDIGMDDMCSKGQKFTWCNNRRGENLVYERLDIILINSNWETKHLND